MPAYTDYTPVLMFRNCWLSMKDGRGFWCPPPAWEKIKQIPASYINRLCSIIFNPDTLQRQNTEISKQIFPEKEYRGLSPNFHIHASVSDLYIPTIGVPILLEEICRPILGLYKSLTDT